MEGDLDKAAAVAGWRNDERRRLRQARQAVPADERREFDARIAAGVDLVLESHPPACLAVYWPLPGEPDLRGWYERLAARGVELALPAVIERNAPLEFRHFSPGEELVPDAARIPSPVPGRPASPDVVIAPVLGFDGQRFRLGNGGGYYDRTLPGLEPQPVLIGVGYARCALESIRPQPHDVPLDYVVTEVAVSPAPGRT